MFSPEAEFPDFPATDAAALHDAAAGLRRLASDPSDAAVMVRAVGASVYGPVWSGSAAYAWADQAHAVYADLDRGVPLLVDAARAADRLADDVVDARAAYTLARADYDTAVTNRDAAVAAVAGGAVHAAAAVTAGGQAMAAAAAAGGRAGDMAAAAGDAAARVFTASAEDPVDLFEFKNVQYQSLSRQLRRQMQVVGRVGGGSSYWLIVKPGGKLSKPLLDELNKLGASANVYEFLPEGLLRRVKDGKVFRFDPTTRQLVEHQPDDSDICAPGVQAEPETVPVPGVAPGAQQVPGTAPNFNQPLPVPKGLSLGGPEPEPDPGFSDVTDIPFGFAFP